MKSSLNTLAFLLLLTGSTVNAQDFLAPHNLTLGVTGQYNEKLKTVFSDAYSKESTAQVMIRSNSPEKVIYIRETEGGPELLTATASTRIYDIDVKEHWKEIERDRGVKINGIEKLQSLGEIKDVTVASKKRNISPALYTKLKDLWQQELMHVRRDSAGRANLTLDGATYDYSMRISRAVFISGTASDGASPRLDKLASISKDLSLLVDGEKSENEILHDISIFNQMPTK
ncbi:hypothetical protein [Pseudomonas sp. DY-1]|uniref:hypothetical protein n=1 Tax=Pseudomonas sp. DY-1 TaxID=1755504 RepID=UPI0013C40F8B|nr:hypothetical protein [Pseudomonas sp. DY-1]